MPRLQEIHANLLDRLQEAEEQGWLGEVAAIEAGLAAAEQKLAAMRDLAAKHTTVHLGLVLNAAVLRTTRYLDAAATRLRALPAHEREHDVLDEDVARVSPLKHANLNCPGGHSLAARPPREGLRPLRDPATVHLDEDDCIGE